MLKVERTNNNHSFGSCSISAPDNKHHRIILKENNKRKVRVRNKKEKHNGIETITRF